MMNVGGQGVVNRGLEKLRQKGTMESNQFNFEREMYRDDQRLLGEELNFNRNFQKETARLDADTARRKDEADAATAQRKVEADARAAEAEKQRIADAAQREAERIAAQGGRKTDADAALEREKLRIKESEDAANRVRNAATADANKATIDKANAGFKAAESTWHAAMGSTGDAYRFTDHVEVGDGSMMRDPSGAKNADGTPKMVKATYSPTARAMQANFDALKTQVDAETDPLKRAQLISQLLESKQLDYNNARGMFSGARSTGGGGGASTSGRSGTH